MIKIGIPIVNQQELTLECLAQLSIATLDKESLEAVVIDNGSAEAFPEYLAREFPFKVGVIRNDLNKGYYYPLLQVCEGTTPGDLVGLMHNDLFIYEEGWDRRVRNAFLSINRLGMLGVCGSAEIDDRGGRGGGTISNFKGVRGQLQEHTGRRIAHIESVQVLDSMLMVMRRSVVDCLKIDHHITLCHFMDKVWPLRTIEAGWRVAVIGLSVDHMGGKTAVEQLARFEIDARRWCDQEGIDYSTRPASHSLYLEAERRFLAEYISKGYVPSRIPEQAVTGIPAQTVTR